MMKGRLIEESFSKSEDRLVEIIQSEKRKERECRKMNRASETWATIKYTNICIMRMTEGEETEETENK